MHPPVITLTTDFGTADHYVGAVKGVILSIAPDAVLVDLTHQVPPQDVCAGSYALRSAAREFPAGTVHLAVVDPGVGGARRAVAVRGLGYLWVGPDNGLFTHVLADAGSEVRELRHPGIARKEVSSTFHGRDLFAPAAAHLAAGFPFADSGPVVEDPVLLSEAQPQRTGSGIAGEILHVDGFGNLITNVPAELLAALGARPRVRLADRAAVEGLAAAYADVSPGALVALIGSGGLLEIGVNGGSAATALGLGRGDPITIEPV